MNELLIEPGVSIASSIYVINSILVIVGSLSPLKIVLFIETTGPLTVTIFDARNSGFLYNGFASTKSSVKIVCAEAANLSSPLFSV